MTPTGVEQALAWAIEYGNRLGDTYVLAQEVLRLRSAMTAEAEHRQKLVEALRETHPSTGCDPYEPCRLCRLAEYT